MPHRGRGRYTYIYGPTVIPLLVALPALEAFWSVCVVLNRSAKAGKASKEDTLGAASCSTCRVSIILVDFLSWHLIKVWFGHLSCPCSFGFPSCPGDVESSLLGSAKNRKPVTSYQYPKQASGRTSVWPLSSVPSPQVVSSIGWMWSLPSTKSFITTAYWERHFSAAAHHQTIQDTGITVALWHAAERVNWANKCPELCGCQRSRTRTRPQCRWKMVKDCERWWKMVKDEERWGKMRKDDGQFLKND